MSPCLRAEFQSKQNRKPTGFTALQNGALCLVYGQLLRLMHFASCRNSRYQFSGRAMYVTLGALMVMCPNTKEVTMDNVDHVILVFIPLCYQYISMVSSRNYEVERIKVQFLF
jgi:hypothetical protein